MAFIRLRRYQRLPYILGCSADLTLRPKRTQSQFPARAGALREVGHDQQGTKFDAG
jgi:hypothetical protein